MIFKLCPALEKGLQAIQISLRCTTHDSHQVLFAILFALEQSVPVLLDLEYLKLLLYLLLGVALTHTIKNINNYPAVVNKK